MLRFLAESIDYGVSERRFDLTVAEHTVPGLLWTPAHAIGTRPLILIGHGGIQHKRIELIVDLARRFACDLGYAVAALDAPDHGERLTREERIRQREERGQFLRQDSRYSDPRLQIRERCRIAAVEWQAAISALQPLPGVGAGPVGYWGVSMATSVGVSLLAAEPRITAAVLGLCGLRPGETEVEQQARAISIPLLYFVQWHDEYHPFPTTLALFDAFSSAEKSMHLNPGPHLPLPVYERDASVAFFARHFGAAP